MSEDRKNDEAVHSWAAWGKLSAFVIAFLITASFGAYIWESRLRSADETPWPNPRPDADEWFQPSAKMLRCLPDPPCDGHSRFGRWRWEVNRYGEYRYRRYGQVVIGDAGPEGAEEDPEPIGEFPGFNEEEDG